MDRGRHADLVQSRRRPLRRYRSIEGVPDSCGERSGGEGRYSGGKNNYQSARRAFGPLGFVRKPGLEILKADIGLNQTASRWRCLSAPNSLQYLSPGWFLGEA